MRNRKSAFFLVAPLLLFSTITFGQESHNGLNTTVAPNLGTYEDGSGFRFFQILSRAFHTQARPLTFAETIAASSVVARGYFVGVIPGRSITSVAAPGSPPIETVFLKLGAVNVLKGVREDYYLIETPVSSQMVKELNDLLYAGDVLFLLMPTSSIYGENAKISVSREAAAELINEKPIYELTLRSALFTISGSGSVTSPLDVSPEFVDIYSNDRSIAALESRIVAAQP